MITVMPPEVQACIDGIPPGHRPLFERLHRLILTADPGAQVTLSYKMPGPPVHSEPGHHGMVLAERLAAGYGDDDPFVLGWREELGSSYAVADVTQAGCG
jgi:hypothetical protein